ncbi:hypothetical protein J4Q44_G00221480 [Coregonus suidteri]|uniref:Uncharacterized protein n=1 Tax=Coregonus suidteri TaxID=861788 RepID=A0AAN8LHZ5_9TELE
MGFELVLKTLPLHCLTHLHLSAIRCEPADHPALEHLRSVLLSQDDCSLTQLSLAGNGRQRSHPRQGCVCGFSQCVCLSVPPWCLWTCQRTQQ